VALDTESTALPTLVRGSSRSEPFLSSLPLPTLLPSPTSLRVLTSPNPPGSPTTSSRSPERTNFSRLLSLFATPPLPTTTSSARSSHRTLTSFQASSTCVLLVVLPASSLTSVILFLSPPPAHTTARSRLPPRLLPSPLRCPSSRWMARAPPPTPPLEARGQDLASSSDLPGRREA
jgi:hypothetical protein